MTFTFDDFPRSALTTGASIIERFGGRATYYVAMGLMGTCNRLGEQFQFADLVSLVERDHEVASHTFSHLSAQATPFEAFSRDVDHGEGSIREALMGTRVNNFAYPYGEVTLTAKRRLGPRMQSCRGTLSGLNGPEVDLNLLRANSLYGNIEQAESAKRLVLENEKRQSWLIFYSHDVTESPSPFGCTPELLEAVVSFVSDRGAKILTVAEVVSNLVPIPRPDPAEGHSAQS